MVSISEIRLYDLFKEKFKLNEADAREVVAELVASNEKTDKVLSEKVEEKFQNSKDIFLTKADKIELVDRIADVKEELANVKIELISKIDDVEIKLLKEITSTKTTLMWSLIILILPIYITILIAVIHNWKP